MQLTQADGFSHIIRLIKHSIYFSESAITNMMKVSLEIVSCMLMSPTAILLQLLQKYTRLPLLDFPGQAQTLANKEVANFQVGLGEDDLAIGVSVISLRDPLSGQRMARPARFIGTGSLVGFDLDTFLMVAQRSRKWQCPHSMRHARVQDLQIDTYLSIVLDCLKVLTPLWGPCISSLVQRRPQQS